MSRARGRPDLVRHRARQCERPNSTSIPACSSRFDQCRAGHEISHTIDGDRLRDGRRRLHRAHRSGLESASRRRTLRTPSNTFAAAGAAVDPPCRARPDLRGGGDEPSRPTTTRSPRCLRRRRRRRTAPIPRPKDRRLADRTDRRPLRRGDLHGALRARESLVPMGSRGAEGRLRHAVDPRRPAVGRHDLGPPGDPADRHGSFDLLPGGRLPTAPSSPRSCRTLPTLCPTRCPTTRRGWCFVRSRTNRPATTR